MIPLKSSCNNSRSARPNQSPDTAFCLSGQCSDSCLTEAFFLRNAVRVSISQALAGRLAPAAAEKSDIALFSTNPSPLHCNSASKPVPYGLRLRNCITQTIHYRKMRGVTRILFFGLTALCRCIFSGMSANQPEPFRRISFRGKTLPCPTDTKSGSPKAMLRSAKPNFIASAIA